MIISFYIDTFLARYESLNQEVEGLWQKERREFGLDEGSRARKENAERKLQETASQLEGLESAVKLILFDEQTIKSKTTKTYINSLFLQGNLRRQLKKTPLWMMIILIGQGK